MRRYDVGRVSKRTPLLILALLAAACASAPPAADPADPTLVILVRHAEREDQLRPGDSPTGVDGALRGTAGDPALSQRGVERAQLIAQLLADAELHDIWSTEYLRTQETAGPTADAAGLPVEPYDPGDLTAFAEILVDRGGRHLVVGHSNTTHELVAALGGNPGPAIEEAEYDRLYVVSLFPDAATTTTLLRFGAPFTP